MAQTFVALRRIYPLPPFSLIAFFYLLWSSGFNLPYFVMNRVASYGAHGVLEGEVELEVLAGVAEARAAFGFLQFLRVRLGDDGTEQAALVALAASSAVSSCIFLRYHNLVMLCQLVEENKAMQLLERGEKKGFGLKKEQSSLCL